MKELKFEFGKATEVTEWAFELNPEYKESGYTRIFITPDTNDYHLLRVLPGYDDDYRQDEGKIILEHNMVGKPKGRHSLKEIKDILIDDDFGNWDYKVYSEMESIIEEVDGGYGINNLEGKEALNA